MYISITFAKTFVVEKGVCPRIFHTIFDIGIGSYPPGQVIIIFL